MALPIWAQFMREVYADDSLGYEKGPFAKPRRALNVTLDCSKYGLDNPADSLLKQKLDSLKIDLDEDDIM